MNIITYHSATAKPEWSWVAYIELPNGEYLGIMFRDYTEDGVKAKAEQFWEAESKRRIHQPIEDRINEQVDRDEAEVKAITGPGRGTHFAGKVWMVNKTLGQKRRVLPSEIATLGEGWVRGGPKG